MRFICDEEKREQHGKFFDSVCVWRQRLEMFLNETGEKKRKFERNSYQLITIAKRVCQITICHHHHSNEDERRDKRVKHNNQRINKFEKENCETNENATRK